MKEIATLPLTPEKIEYLQARKRASKIQIEFGMFILEKFKNVKLE